MKLTKAYSKELLNNIENLYNNAFPKNERKPFDLILEKCQNNQMEILAVTEDDGKFLGLAITIVYSDIVILDYFAISPNHRGKNIGSEALQHIFNIYKGKRLLLEIEDPEVESTNNIERIRRKAFYLKNNMTVMPYKINLFDVQMEVLTCNCFVSFDDYHSVFENVFDKSIADKIKLLCIN